MAKSLTEDRLLEPKPFIKYAGGKSQLLPELEKHIPKTIGRYYEPFVGGGAFFYCLCAKQPTDKPLEAAMGDSNEELILTYKAVCDKPADLIRTLSKYAGRYAVEGEKFYYEARGYNTSGMLKTERAARFIFLNRTCFNGLYRVNKKGEFNVPHGKYKNPTICDEVTLLTASDALAHTEIWHGDFERTVSTAMRGDFVYFDPPYWPASESADFVSYTKDGFGSADHERLRDCALRLKKKGVHVLLSNADVSAVRKLYKGFDMRRVEAKRNINSKGGKRGAVGELLIW